MSSCKRYVSAGINTDINPSSPPPTSSTPTSSTSNPNISVPSAVPFVTPSTASASTTYAPLPVNPITSPPSSEHVSDLNIRHLPDTWKSLLYASIYKIISTRLSTNEFAFFQRLKN